MKALSLAVVGAQYPNKRGPTRLFELALCRPGDPIELRPEPKNPADEYAVAVYSSRGVQIGYLTAERAPWIGGMLNQGRELIAIYQRRTPFGAWIRVGFDGEWPELPADDGRFEAVDAEVADDPGPYFEADPEWPDK